MIDTAIGGMKTRFIVNGKNPTLLILASSKRSEKSFLLPLVPVRTGTQYSYKGTYTDPRSGGVPDDCEWYIGVKDTVSGQEALLYFDIICTVESVALSNTSISF